MSDFYVYDKDRIRIGILQNILSVQWNEMYQNYGEVKIVAQETAENYMLLKKEYRIYNTDRDTVAKIFFVETIDDDEGRTIVARAMTTSFLFTDRVVMATEKVTNIEAGMYRIYSNNRRSLPIVPSALAGFAETTETEITWNSVLDAEQTLALKSGLGFKVIFNPITAVETFVVYKGIDRSDRLSNNYVGHLSSNTGDTNTISILEDISEFKNVAVIAGEGEGKDRKVLTISLYSVTGEDRRELYVDARDLQRKYQIATDTGKKDSDGNPIFDYTDATYTETQYTAVLQARGLEKLSENISTVSISIEVLQNNIVFGRDYFLGDRLPINFPEKFILLSAVVSGVTYVYEHTGKSIIPTFTDFIFKEKE